MRVVRLWVASDAGGEKKSKAHVFNASVLLELQEIRYSAAGV